MYKSQKRYFKFFYPVYEDNDPPEDPAVDQDDDDDIPNNKSFTQDEVNSFLAKEKRKWKQEKDSLINKVEELTKNTNLSDEDRVSWESKIKQIKDENESKLNEALKSQKRLHKQVEQLTQEKDQEVSKYKGMFFNSSVRREITDAATEHEAFRVSQIVGMLQPRSEFRPVLDDEGKETGEYETWVTGVETFDEAGKEIKIDMKAKDAVAALKETDPNLFKSNLKGGLDLKPGKGSGDGMPDPKDYERYKEWRKKHELRRV